MPLALLCDDETTAGHGHGTHHTYDAIVAVGRAVRAVRAPAWYRTDRSTTMVVVSRIPLPACPLAQDVAGG